MKHTPQLTDPNEPPFVEVPYAALSPEALRGLAESVVLREGTDYGERERGFEEKVDEILSRVRRGEARVVFDLGSRSADIVPSPVPVKRT